MSRVPNIGSCPRYIWCLIITLICRETNLRLYSSQRYILTDYIRLWLSFWLSFYYDMVSYFCPSER